MRDAQRLQSASYFCLAGWRCLLVLCGAVCGHSSYAHNQPQSQVKSLHDCRHASICMRCALTVSAAFSLSTSSARCRLFYTKTEKRRLGCSSSHGASLHGCVHATPLLCTKMEAGAGIWNRDRNGGRFETMRPVLLFFRPACCACSPVAPRRGCSRTEPYPGFCSNLRVIGGAHEQGPQRPSADLLSVREHGPCCNKMQWEEREGGRGEATVRPRGLLGW